MSKKKSHIFPFPLHRNFAELNKDIIAENIFVVKIFLLFNILNFKICIKLDAKMILHLAKNVFLKIFKNLNKQIKDGFMNSYLHKCSFKSKVAS